MTSKLTLFSLPNRTLVHSHRHSGKTTRMYPTTREEIQLCITLQILFWDHQNKHVSIKRSFSGPSQLSVYFKVYPTLQISSINNKFGLTVTGFWDPVFSGKHASVIVTEVRSFNLKQLNLGVMCVIHAQEPYLVSEYKCSFSYSEAQEENPEAALVFLKHPPGWLITFDHTSWNLHGEVGCKACLRKVSEI